MSARIGFWFWGFLAGIVAATAVPETLFPGVRPVVFGSTFLAVGLVGEVFPSLFTRRGPEPGRVRDSRLADGRVDLSVVGCRVEPNPVEPRIGRFLGAEPTGPAELPAPTPTPPDSRRSPPLLGRVVMVSLFVGDDRQGWSGDEIAEAHRALTRAGKWLEDQAIRRGAAVNLEVADTYFVFVDNAPDEVAVSFAREGDDVGPWEVDATTKALIRATRAAVSLGFLDAEDLFRAVADRVDADTLVWLMHPRQAGRSFAVPVEDSALRGVSLAVCYPKESSFPEPLTGAARVDPVTIVHELLHLFGATDKYGRPLRDFAPHSVSAREVMRLSESRLSRLRIDDSTAAEIGW